MCNLITGCRGCVRATRRAVSRGGRERCQSACSALAPQCQQEVLRRVSASRRTAASAPVYDVDPRWNTDRSRIQTGQYGSQAPSSWPVYRSLLNPRLFHPKKVKSRDHECGQTRRAHGNKATHEEGMYCSTSTAPRYSVNCLNAWSSVCACARSTFVRQMTKSLPSIAV